MVNVNMVSATMVNVIMVNVTIPWWTPQCTMCILGSTMALWSKAEIQKYTF